MSWVTDIHAHVLPGIDDGPADMGEAEAVLRAHREAGTDRIICTPHYLSPHFDVAPDAAAAAFGKLSDWRNALAGTSDTPLPSIALGAEVRVTKALADVIRHGDVPTLGPTRYVLVEFRSDTVSERALELVHELVVRGYVPVMAHPERNLAVQKDPALVDELMACGVLMQVTARCFETEPRRGHASDKLAWDLLEAGKVAVIASDAHDTRVRPPGLQRAYERIGNRYGAAVVDALMANANAIWEDAPVTEVRVERPRRGGLLRALFG
jgi:protein-tyrosine phosphatase